MPTISSEDIVAHSAEQLSHALQHPYPATPYHNFGSEQIQALQQLDEIFKTMTTPTPNTEYKEYVPSPKQVPEDFKVKETTPLPRVEINVPHIIRTHDNDPPNQLQG
eukprot:7067118-Ditylum_brightwellii.AAC.1